MKMRTLGTNPTRSCRMSKQEWEDLKIAGDAMFKDRDVGYMQVAHIRIFFSIESPYFKDFKELDEQNKFKSDEEVARDKAVAEEIKSKKEKSK